MHKIISCVTVLAALCCASCQNRLPMVPDSGRKVVGPQGSTDVEKPWNATPRAEGDAILGPLSNMRR